MIKIPDTLQEVFDIVSTHLLTQKEKSSIPDGYLEHCKYRGPNGTKCAAGILIPDDQYNPDFEGLPWQDIVKNKQAENKYCNQIVELQGIHDWTFPEDWKFELKTFAEKNNLKHSITV